MPNRSRKRYHTCDWPADLGPCPGSRPREPGRFVTPSLLPSPCACALPAAQAIFSVFPPVHPPLDGEIPLPPIVRSILAVVAGFLFIGAIASGTAAALTAAGVFPPATEPITDIGLVLVETAYVAVYAIAGCWLAAFLAPDRPMRHALILGVLGLAL